MAITHATVKAALQKLFAVAEWNAAHVGTAEPDVHDNTKHTENYIVGADVPANETDPVFLPYEANLITLTNDSMADTLHRHSELSASDGAPDPAVQVDGAGRVGIMTAPVVSYNLTVAGYILATWGMYVSDANAGVTISHSIAGADEPGIQTWQGPSYQYVRMYQNGVDQFYIASYGNLKFTGLDTNQVAKWQLDTAGYSFFTNGINLPNVSASKVLVTDGSKNVGSGTNTDAQIAAAVTASHARQHDVEAAADHTNINALRDSFLAWRKVGYYYSNSNDAEVMATMTFTENIIHVVPFLVVKQETFDRIAVVTLGLLTDGTNKSRLALYNDTGAIYPGTRIVESGELVSTATVAEKAINVTLAPGLYWLAIVHTASGGGARSVNAQQARSVWPIWGRFVGASFTASAATHLRLAQAFGELPATFLGGATETTGTSWLVLLRKSA